MEPQTKKTVLSGIRATGTLHLGNYLGAVKQFVELQDDDMNDCFFFVANLHTITTRPDPEALVRDQREVVLDYLACGLDPDRVTIYTQSSVPELTELTWILACLTPVSELMRMHHFKEKKDALEVEGLSANAGLLIYPVLMAADILAPRADIVPVGEDQVAHVEMARNLARRFNQQYGELFPEPQEKLRTPIRVPSLLALYGEDGRVKVRKMGKSDEDGSVGLADAPDVVWEKFRTAPTDPARKRREDPGHPDNCNIYTYHNLVSTVDQLRWAREGCKTAGIGCVECKQVVSDHVNSMLEPIRERRAELKAKGPDFIDEVLHVGGKRAREHIHETVERAKAMAGVPWL